ncbi:c-type cytochrome [Azospirillum halopraeferens]|uniref:c-type cytochrome n=1 Tax=Azospirillum halopraeferens TaxID=34010 RepID=UPI000416987C|nr:c-type cytochrome [Azospirillum halopraeferens]
MTPHGAVLLAALLLPAAPAGAGSLPAGDPGKGEALFRACAFCHTLGPEGGRRAGPTLHRLFGRVAGAVDGYPYSDALRSSGIVWTEDTVSRLFEIGPDTMTPGSKMPLQRMTDPQQRADLIAYLKRATTSP